MKTLLIVLLSTAQLAAGSDDSTAFRTSDSVRLGFFDCITNIPNDWYRFGEDAFRTENIPLFAGIAISTAATIVYDREMYDPVRKWYESSPTTAFFHDRGVDIGDGKFQFGIALGFGLYGWITDDSRALRTASQVTEVILAGGTIIQILKHSTGRESPFLATSQTGKWVFFPNQITYMKSIPKYDAYPSGHVCTALATLTVVMENYPEAKWLPYVGYPAIAWLAIGMVGQGIHWVSDYPLSIALGYGMAQIVAHKPQSQGSTGSLHTQLFPSVFADGTTGITMQISW